MRNRMVAKGAFVLILTGLKYSLNRLKSEHNVKLITNNIILEQGEIVVFFQFLPCNRNMELWYSTTRNGIYF